MFLGGRGGASILSQTFMGFCVLIFCFFVASFFLTLCRAADIRDKLRSLLVYCISDTDA